MDCVKTREEFSALLDGELSLEARAAMEAHLSECSDCLRELGVLKRLDTLYRGLPAPRTPEDFEQRLRKALRPRIFRFARPRIEQARLWPLLVSLAAVVLITITLAAQFRTLNRPFEVAKSSITSAEADRVQGEPLFAPEAIRPGAAPLRKSRLDDAKVEGKSVAVPEERDARYGVRAKDRDETAFPGHGVAEEAGGESVAVPIAAVSAAPPGPEKAAETPQAQQGEPAHLAFKLGGASLSATSNLEHGATRAAEVESDAVAARPDKKTLAGRTFEKRQGVWHQEGYTGENALLLSPDSEALYELTQAHPELKELSGLDGSVVFEVSSRWYRLEPLRP